MSDLISRSALVGYIAEQIEESKEERSAAREREEASGIYFYSGEISAARRIRRYVNMFAPAVDAVPVVRCRECIYRGAHDLCPMCVRVYQLDEAGYLDCTVDGGFCYMGAKVDAKEDENAAD